MAEVDRAAVLLGNTITFLVLMLICVISRLWFRGSRRALTLSDYCIAIAALSGLTQSSLQIATVTNWGYGQRSRNVPVEIRSSTKPAFYLWINMVIFKLTSMMTKLSLCFVYLDLFKKADSKLVRYSRYVNYGTAFFVLTFYFSILVASAFQCTPIQKSWISKTPGKCVDLRIIRYCTACVNILTSFLVIGLPLPVLFSMKRRGSEVTQIILLVLLGLIHNACAIGRLIIMSIPELQKNQDPRWDSIPGTTASMIEMHIGIIAASLVVMRQLLEIILCLVTGKQLPRTGNTTSNGPSVYINMSGTGHGERRRGYTKSIIETVDMELESKSVSTENILEPTHSPRRMA